MVGVLVGAALEDSSFVWHEGAVDRHGGDHGAVLRHQLLQEALVPLPGPVASGNVGTCGYTGTFSKEFFSQGAVI